MFRKLVWELNMRFWNHFRQVVSVPLSFLLSGPAAGMTPEEEADQVLRQVVGGPQPQGGREKQRSFGVQL